MDCEQSYFSFCTLFPLTIGILSCIHADKLVDIALNGFGVGKFRKANRKLSVQTTYGDITVPYVKLPNMDWEMCFINGDVDVEDGFQSMEKIDKIDKTYCKRYRDLLICEYLYSTDYASGDVKAVIESVLDDYCYVFTIKQGEMIDYKTRIETFLVKIEEI